MNCADIQPLLRDANRRQLDVGDAKLVAGHLASCPECRKVADDESALDRLFEERLPQRPASLALKRRLAARLPAPAVEPSRRAPAIRRWATMGSVAVAACAVLAVGLRQNLLRPSMNPLVSESVADHLRVVYREHPVDIDSGGPHQVKPWFTGRIDFALPSVFGGDNEFTLQGGAVGYYLDRQAAVLVYKRGLHTISLFIFRANGLSFPKADRDLGRVVVHQQHERGFSVVIWRDGELGYSLVSDLNIDDLQKLARLVAAPS